MGTHTPGEWKYGRRADGSLWLSLGDYRRGPHYQGDLIAAEADARLIVTAPKLLALLERIRDDMSWRTNDSALWPDMLALIKEATGDTP